MREVYFLLYCSKSSAHDDEVKKLYEEMEFQIKQEKERVLAEVSHIHIHMPPTSKKLGGHIAFGLSIHPFIHLYFCPFICMSCF